MHKTFFRRSDIQRLVVPPTPVKPYFHLQIGRLGLHIVKLLRNVYYEQIARVRQWHLSVVIHKGMDGFVQFGYTNT